ncbi:MAG: hypothetical protein JXD18_06320 [Anaerolineae bacterium]|nr:hypothetical protein [Anaerolineae bacterium]
MDGHRLLLRLKLLLLTTVILMLAGCGRGGQGVLLEDRFGGTDGVWGNESQDAFDRGYQNGEYFIEVYEPNWFVWARPDERFSDVDVQVDARWVSGSPRAHFGVICRYRSPDDFYYFAVSADGYYAIMKFEDGASEVLTGAGFLRAPVIYTGTTLNIVRALCYEDQLTLYVNGERVASVMDDTFRRGDVGLAVGTGDEGAARVHFDNLVVTGPDY